MRENFTGAAPFWELAAQTAAHIRRGNKPDPSVVLGPVVWETHDRGRRWYFTTASSSHGRARLDRFAADERSTAEALRRGVYLALLTKHRPLVIHDVDTELRMAELAALLWPSPKTRRILANLKAEIRQ
jgi:hypothetical protein